MYLCCCGCCSKPTRRSEGVHNISFVQSACDRAPVTADLVREDQNFMSLHSEALVEMDTTPQIVTRFSLTDPVTHMTNVVPSIGRRAPDFKGTAVIDGQFEEISLDSYGGRYLVLFFYPLDFTFVCPTEIIAFSDRVNEFKDINCSVIACSTDSHFSHLAWINTDRKNGGLGKMDIPLLADKSHKISKAYGILNEENGIAFRGLYIIDKSQNLRQVTINDLPVGRDVDEVLRLVKAFQFTDENGEVCPAGWRPGAKTMKPDTNESKEYFQTVN